MIHACRRANAPEKKSNLFSRQPKVEFDQASIFRVISFDVLRFAIYFHSISEFTCEYTKLCFEVQYLLLRISRVHAK